MLDPMVAFQTARTELKDALTDAINAGLSEEDVRETFEEWYEAQYDGDGS